MGPLKERISNLKGELCMLSKKTEVAAEGPRDKDRGPARDSSLAKARMGAMGEHSRQTLGAEPDGDHGAR